MEKFTELLIFALVFLALAAGVSLALLLGSIGGWGWGVLAFAGGAYITWNLPTLYLRLRSYYRK